MTAQEIFARIRPGDRVTILIPNGMGRDGQEYKEKSGRAVMRGPHGWVLNMGGRFGTPGVCTEENFVSWRGITISDREPEIDLMTDSQLRNSIDRFKRENNL